MCVCVRARVRGSLCMCVVCSGLSLAVATPWLPSECGKKETICFPCRKQTELESSPLWGMLVRVATSPRTDRCLCLHSPGHACRGDGLWS